MVNTPKRSFIDRCFRDNDGRLVIMQAPNAPIVIWVVSTLLQKVTSGTLQNLASLVAFGSLFTWAWLELTKGDSYFRRFLGVIVLVGILVNRL